MSTQTTPIKEFRPINYLDFEHVMLNMVNFHQESEYRKFDLSLSKCREIFRNCIEEDDHFGFIALDEEGFCGLMLGCYSEYYFGGDRIASDLLLYVKPNKRNGTTATRLIRKFEKWAELNICSAVQISVTSGINTDRTVAFFKKLEYHYKGTILQKGM